MPKAYQMQIPGEQTWQIGEKTNRFQTGSCYTEATCTTYQNRSLQMDRAPYILYLENEHTTNQDVFQALQSSGYNILAVTCHSQSIALMYRHKPAVVLLDLTYSDSCSWDLYRQIKEDKNLHGIPIIDIGKRVPVGGRMVMDDTLHSAKDIERLVRSVKALAPQSKMTMSATYAR